MYRASGSKTHRAGLKSLQSLYFLKTTEIIMGIIFSSVIIVLLLVVFAAVTQAAVEYLVDCDDNNTKKEM